MKKNMKNILIKMIRIYQSMPISSHGACKFIPSCSNYAIEAINTAIRALEKIEDLDDKYSKNLENLTDAEAIEYIKDNLYFFRIKEFLFFIFLDLEAN